MALETGTYISDLVPTNPVASDAVAQAQGHLNLIKQVLKNTFPNIKGAVAATNENLSNGTPVGLISMWSGGSIPAGWALCNGVAVNRSDGTGQITPPDLRDRFIVASGLSYATGTTGGNGWIALSVNQLPAHAHSASTDAQGGHNHVLHDPGHNHWSSINNAANGYGPANGPTVTALSGTGVAAAASPPTSTSTTGISIDGVGNHAHNVTVGNTGAGAAIDIRNPFYALAFIMKV